MPQTWEAYVRIERESLSNRKKDFGVHENKLLTVVEKFNLFLHEILHSECEL